MTEIATFAYGPEHGSIEVWGKGRQPMPWFAPERLPGLFERTLVFDRLDLSGGRPEWGGEPLRWLFTGPQGALRIELTPFRLAVVQLYHDSFGLFPQEPFHDGAARNHPERVFATAGVPLDGKGVRSLTVRRDRHLRVVVSVDGCEVLTQRCLLDLFRHQLGGGAKASASGRLLGPDALPAAMRIDPAVRHQTMIGWGGIGAAAAYRSMDPAARSAWWRIVAESNWLIQREYPVGHRLDAAATNWEDPAAAMPHYYGDNHPNGETSCFAYNAAIRRLGGEVWFEFWLLPTWVGQDCVAPDHPHAPDPEAYARAMVAYCRASRDATGHPPEMVGVQNEICQHADLVPGMVKALRRALDAEGFQAVRIHMANASTVSRSPAYIHAHRHDPEAWALIDYAAVNMYDGVRVYHDTDRFREPLAAFRAGTADRPFLSPELSINAQELQHPGWAVALSAAQLVHDNLTRMDAKAVCWCWTLLDVEQPSYGWTRSLCVPDWRDGGRPVPSSGLFRMFRAFSRFVRRGMVRVAVVSGHEDLMASAFVAADGARTLVLINRSVVPRRVDLGAWADLPRWEVTGAGDANRGIDPCRDGLVDLPPGAILTGTDLEPCRLPADFIAP